MAVLEDRSKWRKVTDSGPNDLVRVQIGPHAYQKLRRADAMARGLLPAPVEVVVDGIVEEVEEEKPVVKKRRKAANKMREPQENKGEEEEGG